MQRAIGIDPVQIHHPHLRFVLREYVGARCIDKNELGLDRVAVETSVVSPITASMISYSLKRGRDAIVLL